MARSRLAAALRMAPPAVAVACAGLGVAACRSNGQGPQAQLIAAEQIGAVPGYNTQPLTMATARPVDAYVMLGGRIKTCWFNRSAPLLPAHVYRADVSPGGETVRIAIHDKKDARGLAGDVAYSIDIADRDGATLITTQNRTMTPSQAAKMQYDINRWKSGQTNCSRERPGLAGR